MINLQKLLKQICFPCISDTETERTTGINSVDTIKGNKDPGKNDICVLVHSSILEDIF